MIEPIYPRVLHYFREYLFILYICEKMFAEKSSQNMAHKQWIVILGVFYAETA